MSPHRIARAERLAQLIPHATSDGNTLVLDATGYVITPGFQNTHHHAWYSQLRRTLPDVAVVGEYISLFYDTLAPGFTPKGTYVGTLVSALSCIDSGITNIHDFLSNITAGHSDASVTALRDAGIRCTHVPTGSLIGSDAQHGPQDLFRLQQEFFPPRISS